MCSYSRHCWHNTQNCEKKKIKGMFFCCVFSENEIELVFHVKSFGDSSHERWVLLCVFFSKTIFEKIL